MLVRWLLALFVLMVPSLMTAYCVTLEEYFALVLNNNPFIRQEQLSYRIEQQNISKATASKDVAAEVQALYNHSQPVPVSPFTPTKSDLRRLSASLSKLFWATGGTLSLNWVSLRTDQDIPEITIPSAGGSFSIPTGISLLHENVLALSYSQPLLQNFGGTLNKNAYRSSVQAAQSAQFRSIENIESFLMSQGNDFIDWVLYVEQLRFSRERLQLARKELVHVQKMRAASLVDKTDELRAQDAVHMAEQGVLLAESRLRAKKVQMAASVCLNDLLNMEPEYDLYRTMTLPSLEEALSSLSRSSRTLKALAHQQEALSYQAKSMQESVLPELNLHLRYGLRDGAEVFDDALGFERPEYEAMLLFAYPLGARLAAADARRSEFSLEQLQSIVEKTGMDIKGTMASLFIQLTDMAAILELNRRQVVLAGERTKAELALYNRGQGQLTFVIMSMDSEQTAKNAFAVNAAGYQKLLLHYLNLMDRLYMPGRE